MKKIIVTLLICCMTISLCACGNKPAATAAAESASTEAAATEVAKPAEETAAAAESEPAAATDTITGIVTDASMNNLTVQGEDGTYYMFSQDDSTKVDCKDGILIGEVLDIAYTGSSEAGDAVAVTVSDSSVKAKADREALQFAASVIQTLQFMDQDTLSSMMSYPAYVCVGDIDEEVKDQDAFNALDRNTLFPEDLVVKLSDFNLFGLESSEAGYVLGDGKPNVIFKEDSSNDFGFSITGING